MIKGNSEKMTKMWGGSPANLRPITLNNTCSILKKNPGTAILLLRVLVLWTNFYMYMACICPGSWLVFVLVYGLYLSWCMACICLTDTGRIC